MLYEENEVITVSELCERLMISETTAYKLLRSGEINIYYGAMKSLFLRIGNQ